MQYFWQRNMNEHVQRFQLLVNAKGTHNINNNKRIFQQDISTIKYCYQRSPGRFKKKQRI